MDRSLTLTCFCAASTACALNRNWCINLWLSHICWCLLLASMCFRKTVLLHCSIKLTLLPWKCVVQYMPTFHFFVHWLEWTLHYKLCGPIIYDTITWVYFSMILRDYRLWEVIWHVCFIAAFLVAFRTVLLVLCNTRVQSRSWLQPFFIYWKGFMQLM